MNVIFRLEGGWKGFTTSLTFLSEKCCKLFDAFETFQPITIDDGAKKRWRKEINFHHPFAHFCVREATFISLKAFTCDNFSPLMFFLSLQRVSNSLSLSHRHHRIVLHPSTFGNMKISEIFYKSRFHEFIVVHTPCLGLSLPCNSHFN